MEGSRDEGRKQKVLMGTCGKFSRCPPSHSLCCFCYYNPGEFVFGHFVCVVSCMDLCFSSFFVLFVVGS